MTGSSSWGLVVVSRGPGTAGTGACLVAGVEGCREDPILKLLVEYRPATVVLVLLGECSGGLRRVEELAGITGSRIVETVAVDVGDGVAGAAYAVRQRIRRLLNGGGCGWVVAAPPPGSGFLGAVFAIAVSGMMEYEARRLVLAVAVEECGGTLRVAGERGDSLVCPRSYMHLRDSDDRALASVLRGLIEASRGGGWVGPSELAEKLGLPKSTVHRKLQLLEKMGLAEKSGRGVYRATRRGLACG